MATAMSEGATKIKTLHESAWRLSSKGHLQEFKKVETERALETLKFALSDLANPVLGES
jgi:hypothetical protein